MTGVQTCALPISFNLKDLIKIAAPVALGWWLGPGGASLGGGLFETAAGAGLAVGAGTTALTGSLEKGIMAGLGAYGGAGMGTGTEAMGQASLGTANQSAAETQRLLAQEAIAREAASTAQPELSRQFAQAYAPGTAEAATQSGAETQQIGRAHV